MKEKERGRKPLCNHSCHHLKRHGASHTFVTHFEQEDGGIRMTPPSSANWDVTQKQSHKKVQEQKVPIKYPGDFSHSELFFL